MKFRNKTITVIMDVMCILTAFSFSVSANANTQKTADTTDLSVNDNTESKSPLSPKGNMTSIDDVHQITDTSDKNTIEDKQFITVESKNGNVFYIIIDRSGDTDNVYFLNAVDEADLMALMEDEQKAEITAVCTCTDKCELGAVDENCTVCSKNITKCIGKETVTEEKDKDSDKETKEEPQKSGSPLAGLIILALLGGGGAFYWFKIKNKKPSTKGTTDPSDFEEDDEDDTDSETETDIENDDEPESDEDYEYDDEDMDEADESEVEE